MIGEVNVRGLNREIWALANGIDGMGTLGRDRKLVRQGGGFGLANMRECGKLELAENRGQIS